MTLARPQAFALDCVPPIRNTVLRRKPYCKKFSINIMRMKIFFQKAFNHHMDIIGAIYKLYVCTNPKHLTGLNENVFFAPVIINNICVIL